jgi:hypothetical protein
MVEITYPMILNTIQTVSVVVGIIYYLTIMRNSHKARQAQMLMQLHESKYDLEGMLSYFTLLNTSWEDFDDYFKRYSRIPNPEFQAKMESQMSYYEGLGVLVKNKMVDVNTIHDMMGSRIMSVWMKYETIIRGWREKTEGPGPDYCENFEYLADEIIKLRLQKGLPLNVHHIHPTSQQFQRET